MEHGDEAKCKNLIDVLTEELAGRLGPDYNQDVPEATQQEQLREVYGRIHSLNPRRAALCLSGGGIRSASFSLGVLQGLARQGLLEQFDYLSTVSGGGYIGGWLSAWITHHTQGKAGVMADLQATPAMPLHPEPEPIQHLRAFSNYLTPKLGAFSADTWTLAAIFLRNMCLTWLVLLACGGVVLMLPWFYTKTIFLQPSAGVLYTLLGVAFVAICSAMAYAILDLPSLGNAKWSQNRFLICRQLPLCVAALLLPIWWAGYYNTQGPHNQLLAPPQPTTFLPWVQNPVRGIVLCTGFFLGSYLVGGLLGGLGLSKLHGKRELAPAVFLNRQRHRLAVVPASVLGGLALWFLATTVFNDPAGTNVWNYVCFAPPLVLGVFLVVNVLFVGLVSWVSDEEDREWWGRSAAWLLLCMVAWVAFAGLILWGPRYLLGLYQSTVPGALLSALGGLSGALSALCGWSSKTPAQDTQRFALLSQVALVAGTIVFFVVLSLAVVRLLDPHAVLSSQDIGYLWSQAGYQDANARKAQEHLTMTYLATTLMLAVGVTLGFFVDVNKFSLHALYCNRLIRTFLGAARLGREQQDIRTPHRFTGFDPQDDMPMYALAVEKPFHVINMALNVVQGSQLAWQERKALSFTVSRLHSGCRQLGYRPSALYAGGLSLGTALAISGAAANPNMGYHSSPLVTFLMTLFNVRLGWWLGNPGKHGAKTWRWSSPRHAAGPLFAEAFGMTTADYKYVNLSDGGHFDNLGLYEMVCRRCHYILVVDAGCDPRYRHEDLGNAIRKIRLDFGVPIEMHPSAFTDQPDHRPRCACGIIRYSVVDGPGTDGLLVYLKPVLCGDEPADVITYHAMHADFPHESTADQWFSESQLESYRMLGAHTMAQLCLQPMATLQAFFEHLGTA